MDREFKDWFIDVLKFTTDLGLCYETDRFSISPLVITTDFMQSTIQGLLLLTNLARRISIKYAESNPHIFRPDYIALIERYKYIEWPAPIMRPDCIIIDGQLKIIDFNVDSGIGGVWEVEKVQHYLSKNPLLQYNKEQFVKPTTSLLNYISDCIDNIRIKYFIDNVNLVVIDLMDANEFYKEQSEAFCDLVNTIPGCTAYNKVPEFLGVNRDFIYDEMREYHILYRYTSMIHPENKIKSMFDLLMNAAQTKTLIISHPCDLAIEHKLTLAILSEACDGESDIILTDNELPLVKQYIPWTRLLENKEVFFKGKNEVLPTLAKQYKDLFVLKKINSHNGRHVYIGQECDQNSWDNLINIVLSKEAQQWVIQENLKSREYSFKYYSYDKAFYTEEEPYVFSPFIFGKYGGGALIRVEKNRHKRILSNPLGSELGIAGLVMV